MFYIFANILTEFVMLVGLGLLIVFIVFTLLKGYNNDIASLKQNSSKPNSSTNVNNKNSQTSDITNVKGQIELITNASDNAMNKIYIP